MEKPSILKKIQTDYLALIFSPLLLGSVADSSLDK